MFIDHITVVLVPSGTVYLVLRGIGRISFPIYVFLIAEGCRYTSDRFKYAMRLGAFALISEIPYDLALYPAVLEQTGWGWNFTWRTNVFYTLFFAVAIIHIYETLRRQSRGRQLLGIGCEAAFFAIVILVALYVESPLSIRVMMVVSDSRAKPGHEIAETILTAPPWSAAATVDQTYSWSIHSERKMHCHFRSLAR